VGLVPKRWCLLTLAYYAFPRWYEFGERRWNGIYITTDSFRSLRFASYMKYPKATPMTQGPNREYVAMYSSSCASTLSSLETEHTTSCNKNVHDVYTLCLIFSKLISIFLNTYVSL
jgi:hypothetical protein